MRLFLAIELPHVVRAHLAALAKRLDLSRVRLTRPENLHVTLKFLGEVEEGRVPALCDALANVEAAPAQRLTCDHAELLPPRGPVRVIGVGLGGDVGAVQRLYEDVEARCAGLGFPSERRAYRPHITIARARDTLPNSSRDSVTRIVSSGLPGPPFAANEFVLMESRLKGTGPEYVRLAAFPLDGTPAT